MTRRILVYHPTHSQRVHADKINVMGRVLDGKIPSVSIYLNKALIRRVMVSRAGTFECRITLEKAPEGQNEIEVRGVIGHRTERLMVPFLKLPEPDTDPISS